MEGHHLFGHGHHSPSHQPPPPSSGQAPPTVKIFCQSSENYCLAARDGQVVLAPANPRDPLQHWIKDMRHSTKIKDEEGYPAFALVNKAIGEAIKHSLGQSQPVRLVPYNPEYLDESVLWPESRDVGNGFRCIRMVNNISLNFGALHGNKDRGRVHDGTIVVLWNWCEGDNQSWKIVPYGDEAVLNPVHASPVSHQAHGGPSQPTVKIPCRTNEGYNLTVRNDTVVLAPSNPKDPYQHWIKDMRYSSKIKDEEGYPAFTLVNQATGQALKHSLGESHPVHTTNQLGDNDAITLELSAFEGEGDVIQPGSQPTPAALVMGGLHLALFPNRNRVNMDQPIISDLESQDSLSETEQGFLNIQGPGGVNSSLFRQQRGAAIIGSPAGPPLALPGHPDPQIPQPEDNAIILWQILGSNQSNLIWRLILNAAFNFVAAAMVGVLFLPRNLQGVHTTYWMVMLITTVGVPIVVAVITLLVSFFWLTSDADRPSNWITGLSVANVSMLAGPLVVYWVLTGATGN